MNEIWETLLRKLGDHAPSQEEIIHLIGQLTEGGTLQVEKLSDVDALFERHEERAGKQRRSALNPLSFRLNLFNPDRLLRKFDGIGQHIFRTWMLGVWSLIVGLALFSGFAHWNELRAHAATYLLTPSYLILMWLCFPVIKAVHELAHGLAVRRWGGEVTQMGIALLVLIPAPFVDASAASAFRPAYQRVMVSAAGIMAELLIAALALAIWLNVEPGLVRDIAFALAFIGSVSTVLFNGNPLLRFDGYYMLSDALNLPNLASRSTRYWAYLAQRYLLKLPGTQSPEPASGERVWLLLYAPLSWLYKLFIGMMITFWVASKSFFLGLAAGLFLLFTTLAQPLYKVLRFAFFSPVLGTQRMRARMITAGVAVVVMLAVGVMPMPSTTVAEGVVWLPERAQLRAETSGFIVSVAARDGEMVKPGQLIAVLEDPAEVLARAGYDTAAVVSHDALGRASNMPIFAWPGVGRLAMTSILQRDYPVVQGAVLVISVSYVAINTLTDLLYARLDPRVRREKRARADGDISALIEFGLELRQLLGRALAARHQGLRRVHERQAHQRPVLRHLRERRVRREVPDQRHQRHVKRQLEGDPQRLLHDAPPSLASSTPSARILGARRNASEKQSSCFRPCAWNAGYAASTMPAEPQAYTW